ncbi:unnamed protein product [Mytilus edulis]|uniref:Poly [ADP-ribose] polymerase n=1 Tax=Mytilus edulis TaxID=6550 RepID=A0A8S3UDH1_MYTED|nr:unnamed protein product [Mytilus edulis]
MKPTTSEDTIRYYFESRKVADADVVKMEFIEEKEMYMVWFEEESAIEAVMSKSLRVDGQTLNAKRYVAPPPPKPVPKYDNKVFITNISPTTTKDGLENFLEAKSKGIPEEIIFGEAEGTALVTFEEPPDMEKLQTACMMRQLDGSHLSIHTVPITDCIVVTGYKDNTSSDTMEYYFDNKRRSGVEGVREVKLVEDEGKFLVYFLDPESALTVCKRDHKVEGQILKVQVYYECLGQASIDDDGPKFKSLKPTVIPNIDPKMIEFLLNSETNKVAFEKQLSRHNAVVEWPDSKKIEDKLEVNCTLTEEVKDCRKLAKTWAKTVKTEAEKFFSMLTVKEIQTLQESWDDVLKHLRELSISNPESVAIKVVKEDCKIVIVGHKMPVDEVAEKVEIIMKDVAAEHDRKKLQVTEEVGLKQFQLLVLLYLHFLDKMKKEFEGLIIQVYMKKHIMIFTGMSSHVNAAKVKMFEQIQEITGANAGKFSVGFIEFLKIPEVKTYVGQQFKQEGVLGVWNVQEGNIIMMYSLSDEGAVTACDVLKKSVIEAPITLEVKQSALLGTEIWNDEVKTVELEYQKALVKIVVADSKTVVIYQTSAEDEGIMKEKVTDIFYRHATSEEKMQLPSSELRLLQEQYQTEISTLKEQCSKDRVTLNIDNIHVLIQGNLNGVKDAKQKIDGIVRTFCRKKYTMKKAGIVKHMTSDQEKPKSTGEDSDDEDHRDQAQPISPRKTYTETAMCTTPSGQTIITVVGDITELDVDVIVNAANKDLQHVGGLAKVIVDKGGKSIQKECDDYVSAKNRNKKMYEGEIFCSSPGKLNCKMISHAVGPVWQGALCAGVFGYPVKKATKVIIESIRDYIRANGSDTAIQRIYVCDVKEDTVADFIFALERFYGADSVQKQRGRSGVVSSPQRRRHVSEEYKAGPSDRRQSPASPASRISVNLVKGQIATQEVDVIVNTTSTSLQLNQGAVSQSLLKMGGPGIQAECSQKYSSGIQPGQVAETSGGKLECKMICHGALPGYNGAAAMKTADDNGFVSVAFPALGTGNLGYPKNQVAKNMFSCVDRFSSNHPTSSVCDVRFVVYDKDYYYQGMLKAFEEEQRKRQSGEYVSRQTRNLGPDGTTDQGNQGASGGWHQRALADNRQASVDIGDLTLKVYQGDLTEATVDVIVNGTNRDLDLTRGGVSQAILKKGGHELSQLLLVPAAKKEMKREGVATTTAGRNFSCDFIIHINMEDSHVDLKDKFKTVLEKVDELNRKSVALPALGAGISYAIDKVAESLFEALISFQKKKTDVSEVHVVIYEKEKVSQFLAAMQNCIQSQSNQSQGLFSRFKGMLGYGEKKAVSTKQWTVSKMPSSVLNLVVYAKKQNDADSALRSLEESLISDYKEKLIEDTVVKDLTKEQEAKIMKLEETCEVEIEFNRRIGRIKVRGLIENLSEAMDDVHKILRDFDRQRQKQQHAKLVADMVQWYFISVEDTGQKLEEYPAEVNLLLEQALKNNEPKAFFLDNSGNKYIVDFTDYEEYPEDDPSDTVAVLRKSKMTDSAFDMPSNWAAMDQNENIKIVTLQPADKEYQDVVKDFQTNMAGNYNSIVKMEKIQNRTLQQQYAAKKKSMDSTNAKGNNNELKLWHGTAMEAVDSINTYGFNRSYCGKNAVAYGNGVYFAVNPTYSAQAQYARPDPNGNKRMYMCKVLVGEYTKRTGWHESTTT